MFPSRLSIPLRATIPFLLVVFGMTMGPACADVRQDIYKAACLKPDSKEAFPEVSSKEFLVAFYNQFAVPYPGELLVDRDISPGERCKSLPADGVGFLDYAKMCGFPKAADAGFSGAFSVSAGDEGFDKKLCPPDTAACKVMQEGYVYLKARFNIGQSGERRGDLSRDVGEETLGKFPETLFVRTAKNPFETYKDKQSQLIWDALNKNIEFDIQCGNPRKYIIPVSVPTFLTNQPIVLAREPSDAMTLVLEDSGASEKQKANPFEIGVSFDRQNRMPVETNSQGQAVKSEYNDVIGINGTLGRKLGPPGNQKMLAFVQLDYKSAFVPTEETDDLSFGLTGDWRDFIFGKDKVPDWLGSLNTTAQWMTDIEERDSAVWKIEASAQLDLPLISHWETDSTEVAFLYGTTLVTDYIHAVHIGDKENLANVGEAFRVGYDIQWKLNYGLFVDIPWKPDLTGSYKYRDTLGSGAGNADLVTIDLALWKAEKTFGPGLNLQYQRGETIDTFLPVETYGLKFTLK